MARVDGLGGAGVEEEGEEDAGGDQHDEAVHRDLAEQECPVIGENLVERLLREGCGPEAVVDPGSEFLKHRSYTWPRFQKPGPTGSV